MERKHKHKSNISGFGLTLILVGIVLLIARLDPLGWHSTWSYFTWQVILIIVGTVMLKDRDSRFMGVLLIALGFFFLLPRITFVPWQLQRLFWPGVLILLGLIVLLSRNKNHHRNNIEQ